MGSLEAIEEDYRPTVDRLADSHTDFMADRQQRFLRHVGRQDREPASEWLADSVRLDGRQAPIV